LKRIPILDTEILFAFNPKDKHYKHAKKLLNKIKNGEIKNVYNTDSALLEFITVLRSRGFGLNQIRILLTSLDVIITRYGLKEALTLNLTTLLKTLELMKTGAAFFDALLAASSKKIDNIIISDGKIYDTLNINRITFKE